MVEEEDLPCCVFMQAYIHTHTPSNELVFYHTPDEKTPFESTHKCFNLSASRFGQWWTSACLVDSLKRLPGQDRLPMHLKFWTSTERICCLTGICLSRLNRNIPLVLLLTTSCTIWDWENFTLLICFWIYYRRNFYNRKEHILLCF
jgi:hypothetical protein